MALTRTSTTAAIGVSDLTIPVTSTTGFPAVGVIGSRQRMVIDDESMLVEVVPVANTVKVLQRGYNGTIATTHDILAPVITSSVEADFAGIPMGTEVARPPFVDDQVNVGQNGIIAVPIRNTTILLTKGSALSATTLGAPGKDQDGVRLTITSGTAFAHVITATGLLADGVTGGNKSTATFGAFVGASLVLVAANGAWNVVSQVVCVLS